MIGELSFDQINLYLNEGKQPRGGIAIGDDLQKTLQEVRRLRNGQIGLG